MHSSESLTNNPKINFDKYENENILRIMKGVIFRSPRNPFTQFVISKINYYKEKNKNIKINFQELNYECIKEWKAMKDYEKKKYFDLFEEEKRKYKLDIEIVKHYLFNDYNDIESRSPTAYEIFLNEKLREGLENYCAPELVRVEADYIWDKMTEDQKKKYTDSERKNENWFLEAKTLKKITPLTLFIHKKFQEAKKKGRNYLL